MSTGPVGDIMGMRGRNLGGGGGYRSGSGFRGAGYRNNSGLYGGRRVSARLQIAHEVVELDGLLLCNLCCFLGVFR